MEIALQSEKIYIANKPVDFRKSIDGLSALVIEDLQKEPNKGIYIFYNKSLNRIKVLGWHRNGFVMIYKRLESGKFFVRYNNDADLQINSEQLNWLLIGLDWVRHEADIN
ncbi:MAG: IS66 family insertion sequence element accessory protein TnpB [Methylomarinum sp.]|nr:IS66 family insertion sequence element accessory protein TnpB [Methylomarinum sp.]